MAVDNRVSAELEELRARLTEAEETLRAIRHGEVDALLITDPSGDRVYTLRSADAPYRFLVEQMNEGAVTVNTKGDIVYCNQRFADLVGEPLQRVIGAPAARFIDDTELTTLANDGSEKLRTRIRTRDGAALDVHVSLSHLTVDDVEHRVLIVTDISTLTKAQRESQSKDEFLAMLAHELRNPLSAITGAVHVLGLGAFLDARAVRARDVIQRQALYMARLVDDLLDVGRVVTGKIVLDKSRIDVAESLRISIAAVTSTQKIDTRIEVETESVWVNADPVRLEQIIGNLLSNALKFTPPDKKVRVSVYAEDASAVLRVTDEGVGIDPDMLVDIFDLFVQADDTIDRAKGGLGIGLTLVRRLVELHGGTVEASSDGVGHGATFTVRLPIASVPAAASAGALPTLARRPSKRVLLVDDHADVREMYALVLQSSGHVVIEADNGADALDVIRTARLDAAIVDIGLPQMDGYELARRIRLEPAGSGLVLIALTGYGFPEDRARSRAAGFDRHLVKPATFEDLLEELDAVPRQTSGELPG
jgi:two-component system, sensor histidine kinase